MDKLKKKRAALIRLYKYYFYVLQSAIVSGVLIGISAIAKVSCENQIVGAFLFAFGLFFICSYNKHLFTGRIADLTKTNYRIHITIWLGNFIGALFISILARTANPILHEKAIKVMGEKLSHDFLSTSILALFCGIVMFLATNNYKVSLSEDSKFFGIVFGVMVFVISNFEHSIADMAYAGLYISSLEDLIDSIDLIFNVTLFNAIGSIFMKKLIQK